MDNYGNIQANFRHSFMSSSFEVGALKREFFSQF